MTTISSLQESTANLGYLVKEDTSTRGDLICITLIVTTLIGIMVCAVINGGLTLQWPTPEFFLFVTLVIAIVILVIHRIQKTRDKLQSVPEERKRNENPLRIKLTSAATTSVKRMYQNEDGLTAATNSNNGRHRTRSFIAQARNEQLSQSTS